MPWTRRQVKYLLSSVSPLSGEQKGKMKSELHQNPSMGHEKKGSTAMKHNIHSMRIQVHRGSGEVTGHTVYHTMMPKATKKSGAFLESTEHAYPFGPDGHSPEHGHMSDHIAEHLGLSQPEGHERAEDNEGEAETAKEY